MTDATLDKVAKARDVPPPPSKSLGQRLTEMGVWMAIAVVLIWAWEGAEMNPASLWTGRENMWTFFGDFLEPDFRRWELYLDQMLVTVQIALWGTGLAVLFGIPFGILSSENLLPAWVVFPVRRMMDALRAVNELVFALLFLVAVGLGPFAGTLAIFVHTTGVLAKLYSEAVEAIDPRPVEGIRATGANRVQEVIFGVIPQVLPLWISYTLYRFESNVRSATVIGIVGAGGIGQVFYENMRSFEYGASAAIIIIIILTVSALDIASQWLRKRVT